MKRIKTFLVAIEQSIVAAETPDKKREQIEAAKIVAPKILNGIWLELAMIGLSAIESTIKG